MTPIEPERTLAELVLERPERTRVFEELQLDYCCGGGRSVAEAAAERGLDVDAVTSALEEAERSSEAGSAGHDLGAASLSETCDHIVDVHHAFLRSELPRISALLAKVARRHGGSRPALHELEREFSALRSDLIEHIDREEEGVFVLCRSLDAAGEEAPTISPRMGMHEAAHEKVGEALASIRELAGDYRIDEGLCMSHRALLQSLHGLEGDLHLHIHEENNVLFPKLRRRLVETAAATAG